MPFQFISGLLSITSKDIPQSVSTSNPMVDQFMAKIHLEVREKGISIQYERDQAMWFKMLQTCGKESSARYGVLVRIGKVLRFGNVIYRTDRKSSEWKSYAVFGKPAASLLSHGGRILIQLPKVNGLGKKFSLFSSTNENFCCKRDAFWAWLLTGKENGDVDAVVSKKNNGDACEKEGKIVFKRLASTHDVSANENPENIFNLKSIRYVREIKTTGVNMQKAVHYGMNLPIGGYHFECEGVLEELIESNGRHGHLYIYYSPPTKTKFGSIMIGLETSEPGKISNGGFYHSAMAKSAPISPTYGFKWKDIRRNYKEECPDKYDSVFIDFVTSDWRYIKSQEWKNEYIKDPTLSVDEIGNLRKAYMEKMLVS